MNLIYSKNEFNIYKSNDDGYIVHNTKKKFADGHSHIRTFNQSRYIVEMVTHKIVPNHLSIYLLTSLIRISNDEIYQEKIQGLIDSKKNRGQRFYTNNMKNKYKFQRNS